MNVFVIPSWYPTPSQPISGAFIKEQVYLLARNHQEMNFAVSLWGANENDLLLQKSDGLKNLLKLLKKKGSHRVTRSGNLTEYYTPAYTWTRKWKKGNIREIIMANETNLLSFQDQYSRPDVLHAYIAYPGGFVARKLSEKFKIPYVVSEQMSPFPMASFRDEAGFSELVRSSLEKAGKVISPSNSQTKEILTNCPKAEVITIPNFVDEMSFRSQPSAEEEIRLLAIGRLEKQKGFEVLLEAFSQIVKHRRSIRLVIAGDGSLKEPLKEQAERLQLGDHVSFPGRLNKEEVIREMEKCTFFCLPSLHESFGIVCIEALACGKPLVATLSGGPEDIVFEGNGLLARNNDLDDLREKLLQMLATYKDYDPEAIREDFMLRFSSVSVTPRILDLYQSTMTNYQPGV